MSDIKDMTRTAEGIAAMINCMVRPHTGRISVYIPHTNVTVIGCSYNDEFITFRLKRGDKIFEFSTQIFSWQEIPQKLHMAEVKNNIKNNLNKLSDKELRELHAQIMDE